MAVDLDHLKTDIPAYLESRGFVAFHGVSRSASGARLVAWDVPRRPDYREFLDVAAKIGIKIAVLYSREFERTNVEDVLAELEESDVPPSERRDYEHRLHRLLVYEGFTCALELSFDYEDRIYLYEVRAEWFNELLDIMADIDSWYGTGGSDEDETSEDDGPVGGYFSRN
jgi:hypothetical protein